MLSILIIAWLLVVPVIALVVYVKERYWCVSNYGHSRYARASFLSRAPWIIVWPAVPLIWLGELFFSQVIDRVALQRYRDEDGD